MSIPIPFSIAAICNLQFAIYRILTDLYPDHSVRHRGPDWSESQPELQHCAVYVGIIGLTKVLQQVETSVPRALVS